MKKNVLVFGIISGVIVSALMLFSVSIFYNDPDFEGNMALGYAAMLAAFSLVYVGIRNYRNKYNNGSISFGQAFKLGLLITLIASTMYVLTWLVDYYFFVPDFMERYVAHVIDSAKQSGASAAEIAGTTQKMIQMKEAYKNPVWVILITYSEVLPVGLVVTLISALILKRKPKPAL